MYNRVGKRNNYSNDSRTHRVTKSVQNEDNVPLRFTTKSKLDHSSPLDDVIKVEALITNYALKSGSNHMLRDDTNYEYYLNIELENHHCNRSPVEYESCRVNGDIHQVLVEANQQAIKLAFEKIEKYAEKVRMDFHTKWSENQQALMAYCLSLLTGTMASFATNWLTTITDDIGDPYKVNIIPRFIAMIKDQSGHYSAEHSIDRLRALHAAYYKKGENPTGEAVRLQEFITQFNACTPHRSDKILTSDQLTREFIRFFSKAAIFSDTIGRIKEDVTERDRLLATLPQFDNIAAFTAWEIRQSQPSPVEPIRYVNPYAMNFSQILSQLNTPSTTAMSTPTLHAIHTRAVEPVVPQLITRNGAGLTPADETHIISISSHCTDSNRVLWLECDEKIIRLTRDKVAQSLALKLTRDTNCSRNVNERDEAITIIKANAWQAHKEEREMTLLKTLGTHVIEFHETRTVLRSICHEAATSIATNISNLLTVIPAPDDKEAQLLTLTNSLTQLQANLVVNLDSLTTRLQARAVDDTASTREAEILRQHAAEEVKRIDARASTLMQELLQQTGLTGGMEQIAAMAQQLLAVPTREESIMTQRCSALSELLHKLTPASIISTLSNVFIRHRHIASAAEEGSEKRRSGNGRDKEKDKTQQKACHYFASNGTCRFGDDCKYSHPSDSKDLPPPTKKHRADPTQPSCSRCGRNNHELSNCAAYTHLNGVKLDDNNDKPVVKAKLARWHTMSSLDDVANVIGKFAKVTVSPIGVKAMMGKVQSIVDKPIFDTGASDDVSSSSANLTNFRSTPQLVVEGVNGGVVTTIEGMGQLYATYNTQFPNVFVQFGTIMAVVPQCGVELVGANKFANTDPRCVWTIHLEYNNNFLQHKVLKYNGESVKIPLEVIDGLTRISRLRTTPRGAVLLQGGGVPGSVKANIPPDLLAHANMANTRSKRTPITYQPLVIKPGLIVIMRGEMWENEPSKYCEGHVLGLSDKQLQPDGFHDPHEPLWEVEFLNQNRTIEQRYELFDVAQSDITTSRTAADKRLKVYQDWTAAGSPNLFL